MCNHRTIGTGLFAMCLGMTGCTGGDNPSPSLLPSVMTTPSNTARVSATGAPVPDSGSVAVIGDSLTYQDGQGGRMVVQSLVDAGWKRDQICYSGSPGRTIVGTLPGGAPSATDEVARCRKEVGEPSLWIIALVTNDLGKDNTEITKDMNTLLNAIGTGPKVLWVGAGRKDKTTPAVLQANPAVRRAVEARPASRYVDWLSYLSSHPRQEGWWQPDGTHMTLKGYAARNTFIADQAKQFAQA